MSDEETHRKKEAEKAKVETWGQTQKVRIDVCKHVSKTTDQLKKHMISAHNGHKNTTWMFCGDCEYATRVEEELVNHVKHHFFSILGDDKDDDVPIDDDEDDETPVSKTGLGNYDPNPMNCGDCPFETHYENELFEHLKMHMDQLKKHMIIAHNGHKSTTWMLYEVCEYATRVEEEFVNHVEHHHPHHVPKC